ncbi:protein kinase A regulatory subunit [Gloeophyllum trabeum ATCC 11539]|uniref:cAMP-dependent protein kinase regulatory subunit n=1 Tax=Gloeophyllum trabeum (strain ATCC 11539 / FP-39264 / Madison 617) TaxID=670483 RepID=S7QJ01_GLOTA|nr:protein kinase A regulatory subunit [Gloeophyllum trabeum ATCC 11539]EPQ59347.1 protein kinase A regulatory subunit [Gloeophyllum trabeum ATCC 11539]
MSTSTFDALIADLTRDAHRAQPRDALQFCANWFQSRLEEQRALSRDILAQRRSFSYDLPQEHYQDIPISSSGSGSAFASATTPPYESSIPPRAPVRQSIAPGPFGTLDVPGNALLPDTTPRNNAGGMLPPVPPVFRVNGQDLSPVSPLTVTGRYSIHESMFTPPPAETNANAEDYLQPFSSTILARRTSVSAESIPVDSDSNEPLPVFPKTPEQLRRIKASIANNFIFRDLDEEQETGVLNAMQEMQVPKDEVVIRQGDVGEYFYVVESGLFYCYIREDENKPSWYTAPQGSRQAPIPNKPGYHPEFGKKVSECKPGSSFGELALMYGHPRAATVQAIEPSVLWSLDRITFRTIILKAAHRRRTMYEQFLSTVPLLSSLSAEERSKIADALVSRVYQDGEAVVRQGEMGDTFFFIEDGEATVTKTQQGEDGQMNEITVGRLTKGDYFGELSLLRMAPRAATVSAIFRANPTMPKLKVAALDANAFTRLLGPLREIMERNAGEAYGLPPYRFPSSP